MWFARTAKGHRIALEHLADRSILSMNSPSAPRALLGSVPVVQVITTLHKWHRGLPRSGYKRSLPTRQRRFSTPADANVAALVPERVMVRAAGTWSNTTSLRGHQCQDWRDGSCPFRVSGLPCKMEK
jgi:hypothetical protein